MAHNPGTHERAQTNPPGPTNIIVRPAQRKYNCADLVSPINTKNGLQLLANEYSQGNRLERELGVLRRQVQTMDEFIQLSCDQDVKWDAYVEKTFDKAWKRMDNQRKDLERMHRYEGELGNQQLQPILCIDWAY